MYKVAKKYGVEHTFRKIFIDNEFGIILDIGAADDRKRN